MGKEVVATQGAPKAIGPYSQAVAAGPFVFCSGQIALDPATGRVAGEDAASQTERVLLNLKAVLEASGLSLGHVVKTTVFLRSLEDFPAMNEVYGRFFPSDPPARSTVEVSRLPKDVKVEIEAVAVKG